ncbi:MAG: hypothetical protein ACJ8KF_14630 [Chthoniobacterales bacterium]
MPLSLGLVFMLASTITQLRGEDPEKPSPGQLPVVSIHSTGDVTRGKTGAFVLAMSQSAPTAIPYYPYVNFKVSGTAIPGVDYVALVSPAYVGPDGYGVILVKTLPDPRGFSRQGYTVVVTLEHGLGYTLPPLVAATSAKITIKL